MADQARNSICTVIQSTLHLATEATGNAPPAPSKPGGSQSSWLTPAAVPRHSTWAAADTHFFASELPGHTYNMVHTGGRNPLHAPNPATRIVAGGLTTRLASCVQSSATAFTPTCAGIHASSHFLMLQEPDPA